MDEASIAQMLSDGSSTIATVFEAHLKNIMPNMAPEVLEHVLETLTSNKHLAHAARTSGWAYVLKTVKPHILDFEAEIGPGPVSSMVADDEEIAEGFKLIVGNAVRQNVDYSTQVQSHMHKLGLFKREDIDAAIALVPKWYVAPTDATEGATEDNIFAPGA